MSAVFAVPVAPPTPAPVYQNAALSRAHSAAHAAYEKMCAERGTQLSWQLPCRQLSWQAVPPTVAGWQMPQAIPPPAREFTFVSSGSAVAPPMMQGPLMPLPQASPLMPQSPPVSRMTSAVLPGGPLLDPVAVDKQKLQIARNLLDRLQTDTAALTQQNQDRKKMLAQYAAQQKAQHATQVDSDLQRQALVIEQRGSSQLLQVQQAVNAQKIALEQQAASLVNTYRLQKAEEDRMQPAGTVYYKSLPTVDAPRRPPVVDNQGQRNNFRDVDSFDSYLGRPGGRPKPPRSDYGDD